MDEPGRKGAHALIERLGRHRCKLVSLPHKDANECLQKGVTLPEFIACFRAAESLRPDELLRFDELIDQVKVARQQQQANGGVPTGLMLPWAKANRFWFQPGKMTMISGYSGHGKTTMYSHVIAYAIAQGERWCIASLEMSGAETVERLSRQLAGKSALNDYQLDNLGAWVGDRCLIYDHLGQANLKAILDVFTYSARRYGCTQFCLDSLMMLGVGHEDYDRQQAVVSELLAFARTHHAHVHLIHHPRKPANDDSAPNRYDIKGTGGLTDMVPNVLIAWRNRKKDDAIEQAKMTGIPPDPMLLMEPDATLKIDKNRLNGWEPTLQLWFDADSQQYLANQGDLPVVYAPCTLATGPINPPSITPP
jgi:twinkle protein